MHNYAVIQQKKGKYRYAEECYKQAGLEASLNNIKNMREQGVIKEDLFLVIGSTRGAAGNHGSPIMDEVYGTKDIDLPHLKTFQGRATTCDIERSFIPDAKHIVADALTFDFSKKYNIKNVLFERLPTSNPNPSEGYGGLTTADDNSSSSGGVYRRAKLNFYGAAIANLSRAMQPGAVLEMEWDPYCTMWDLNRAQSEEYHVANPFHGLVSIAAGYFGADRMYGDDSKTHLSAQYTADIISAKMERECAFLHSRGGGRSVQEIKDRIHAETEMLMEMLMGRALNQKAHYTVLDAHLLMDSTDKVLSAMRTKVTTHALSPAQVGKQHTLPDGRRGTVYDADLAIQQSLFGVVLNNIAVQNNAPYAKRYLESAGFVDVTIERRTNPHNGRKNVWMVRAVKG